ncbi:methyl-accepting chemotaxis protein, partial [endosymbiont of Ridgeia piscesae]
MKKLNITIKGLLIIWVVTAVAVVLIQVLTSLTTYQSISENQQKIAGKAIPLQTANYDIKNTITGVFSRQSKIISTNSLEKLMSLKNHGAMEKIFASAMASAKNAAGDDVTIKESLTALEKTYEHFINAGNTLFEKKKATLQINQEQADFVTKMDSAIQIIQQTAESIAGKINFSNKRAKRRIRKLYNKIQDFQDINEIGDQDAETAFQFRDQVSASLLGRSANLQQESSSIRTGVAIMGGLGRQFMLESNPDILTSIKENQLAQVIQATKGSIVKVDEESSDNKELNKEFDRLVETLINEKISILTLRRKSLRLSKEMRSALTDMQSAGASMEQALNTVVKAVDKIQAEAEEQGYRVIRSSRTILLVTASVALVVLIFISFIVLRRVNRPLAMATKSMRRFAQGDISTRMDYKGKDEFSILAHDF